MEKKHNKITKKDLSYFISQNTGLSVIYVKKIIEDLLNFVIIELIDTKLLFLVTSLSPIKEDKPLPSPFFLLNGFIMRP